MEKEYLFYHEYEAFYEMAAKSDVFGAFCKKAFGGDFSQDGFSDIRQIDRILPYIPKTENVHTTKLAEALRAQDIAFETEDITKECYELLWRKRETALSMKEAFYAAGEGSWYQMLIGQTEYVKKPFEAFRKEMARYLFVAKKEA